MREQGRILVRRAGVDLERLGHAPVGLRAPRAELLSIRDLLRERMTERVRELGIRLHLVDETGVRERADRGG